MSNWKSSCVLKQNKRIASTDARNNLPKRIFLSISLFCFFNIIQGFIFTQGLEIVTCEGPKQEWCKFQHKEPVQSWETHWVHHSELSHWLWWYYDLWKGFLRVKICYYTEQSKFQNMHTRKGPYLWFNNIHKTESEQLHGTRMPSMLLLSICFIWLRQFTLALKG